MSANSAHFTTDFKQAKLIVPERVFLEMRSQATSAYPEEGCGLIFGIFENNSQLKVAKESRRMDNVFLKEERFHRYTIDPKQLLLAESEAEGMGQEIVGIYHSHPNAPARPSEFDMKYAWPTLSYVITSVKDSGPDETKSWVLKDDRSGFVEEELEIEKK